MEEKNLEKELEEVERELEIPKNNIEIGKVAWGCGAASIVFGGILMPLAASLSKGSIDLEAVKIGLTCGLVYGALFSLIGAKYYFSGKHQYNKTRDRCYKQTLFPDYFLGK